MPLDREYGTKLRLLRILRALIEHPYGYTKRQLADRYDVSPDTIKGDFTAFRNAGFVVDYDEQYRYALQENKAYRQLRDLLHFNEEEQFMLAAAIDQIAGHSRSGGRLKRKLASLYDYHRLGHAYLRRPYLTKVDLLLKAKETRKQVILKDYRSSNSNVVSDRRVEPFHPSPPDDLVQAYDVEVGALRHYRISRFTRVELTGHQWEHSHLHRVVPSDPFRIVDSKQKMVHLRMRVGAYNELTERFPLTKAYVQESEEPDVYDLQCMVNHRFLGLTNFILGNHHQVIEVIEPDDLIDHLNAEVKSMKF